MGGCLDIFSLVYHFSFLSPSLWETARYRLKYCLKGPLSPKITNQRKQRYHDPNMNAVKEIEQPKRLTQNFHIMLKSRKKKSQKLTQLSSKSHPRHLVGKKTAQKHTIIDITSDSQVNSNFPYRWSPASLTFNNYFYLFLYLYIT